MKKALLRLGSLITLTLSTTSAFAQEGKNPITRESIESYKFNETYSPSAWKAIQEKDIAWKKRVWRTVDISEAGNQFLGLASTHTSIGDMLLNGVYSSSFKPHGAYNEERFTTEFSAEQVERLKATGVSGKDITLLKIKEDWLFLKDEQKMVVRIIGMAPVVKQEDGTEKELFWLYYPDTREYLQKQRIAAKGTHPETMDEVFEGRFFSSKIEKLSGGIATSLHYK